MSTTETPAALLRDAAALLRKRVSAASPGRWRQMCLGSEGCQVINAGYLCERRHVARFGRKEWKADHADAEYVASMDPAVGAALADWLEATAAEADDLIKPAMPDLWGCDRCGEYLAPGCCQCWDKALTVARAYLDGAK